MGAHDHASIGCFGRSRKHNKAEKKEISTLTKPAAEKSTPFSKRWRDLSGQTHWNNMLEPLDLDLRQYIIHYGELAQAAYDTFNKCKESPNAGSSIYSKHDFFSKVGLVKANPYCKYEVTKYLYATSSIRMPDAFMIFPATRDGWAKESNWIGYVAVTTDEGAALMGRRDIVVAFRGTIQTTEWINDFDFALVDGSKIFADKKVKIHSGWLSIYTSHDDRSPLSKTSARDQLLHEITRLMDLYKDEEVSITICGHSLGGSLATLSAADIVFNGYNKHKNHSNKACPVTAFAFASPRVGGSDFKKLFSGMEHLRTLRVKNILDVVCTYPLIGYDDVGEELTMDSRKSPYVKRPGNAVTFHNMEGYLHSVAGTHGTKGEFKLVVKRDIALLNKEIDALKDEYMIPHAWRALKNNGMVQQDDGSWKLMDREPNDY